MNWEYFYENYGEWEESKLLRCVRLLEDLGTNDEIVDVVNFSGSEKANAEILKMAVNRKMFFSYDEVVDMECGLDDEFYEAFVAINLIKNPNLTFEEIMKYKNDVKDILLEMVLYDCNLRYTQEQLDLLEKEYESEFIEMLYKKQGMRYRKHAYVVEYSPCYSRGKEKVGLFARFGIYKLVSGLFRF